MKVIRFLVIVALLLCTTLPIAHAAEGITLVQLCDTQLGMGEYKHDVETFELAVKQINALRPDLVFICGDLINKTSDDKAFEDFKRIKSKFTVPVYCASGNHDVGNEPTIKSLKRYRAIMGDDYYSVEHKGYTFIVTNTQLWKYRVPVETEKHEGWVRTTLRAAKAKQLPVFMVGHYPLFTESIDEEEKYYNIAVEKRRELFELYCKSGVVAILAGHTHRNIVVDYKGIQMVASATTSRNFDNAPMGFRVWHIEGTPPFKHEYIAVEGAVPPPDK